MSAILQTAFSYALKSVLGGLMERKPTLVPLMAWP